MAKGSVRKKGKKWYYRFYVEDASGKLIQREYVGTESKSETEKLLRQAIEDYEEKNFVAKTENITLGELLDIWAEEELKVGALSNGTVELYTHVISRIKRHPIASRKLKTVTADHLQAFMDLLVFGGMEGDFRSAGNYCKDHANKYSAVLNQAFRFAVFPKKFITFNPMQYVVRRNKKEGTDIFNEGDAEKTHPLTREMYNALLAYLKQHHPDAVLPVQISYYTGLRLGEVAGLTWQDINLKEQYLTVRRSIHFSSKNLRVEIGPTKRGKIRTEDFDSILTKILKEARKQQKKNVWKYRDLYRNCYFKEAPEKNRVYYIYGDYDATESIPEGYREIDLVCRKECGCLLRPATIDTICRLVSKKVPELEGFHFHVLRHTYTTNLLANGALPKDVQELLGHSSVNTTMNVYAHATRESKKAAGRLLDKITG